MAKSYNFSFFVDSSPDQDIFVDTRKTTLNHEVQIAEKKPSLQREKPDLILAKQMPSDSTICPDHVDLAQQKIVNFF